ncbi:hypothetical protein Tco_1523100 [Tanacetum coccineum]
MPSSRFNVSRTYEEHEYELNNNMTRDLEEPRSEYGVPYQLCDHICEPYHFKNGKDHKWYDELADGVLKEEALIYKARFEESWGDATPRVMKFYAWKHLTKTRTMIKPASEGDLHGSDNITHNANLNAKFEIGDEFLKILQDNTFNGVDKGDVTDHMEKPYLDAQEGNGIYNFKESNQYSPQIPVPAEYNTRDLNELCKSEEFTVI